MNKKICRTAAVTLAASLILGQAAFADVVTADAPGASGGAVSSSVSSTVNSSVNMTGSSGTTSGPAFGTPNENGTKAGYISQTGPTAEKQLDANGVLVIGAGSADTSDTSRAVIGPGGNVTQNSQTAGAPTGQTAAASFNQAAMITIDQSIQKPELSAEAGLLYDATSGQILFEKNGSKAMYPASTTKLLTALLAAEKLSMSDTITFTDSAVNHLESGAVTVNMRVGDTMTVEDAMYAMLLKSACEVSNAIAEKVSGSQEAFAALMNQRAKELGCTGSNFANASGLNNTNHYTTAADMALITAAALNNAEVRKVLGTTTYTLPATSGRSSMKITTGNKMVSGGVNAYPDYIGGKTGYTSKAGNCLSGAAAYRGHELVAVVFKSNSTHYQDSKKLFDYGKKLIDASGAGTASASPAATGAQAPAASSGSVTAAAAPGAATASAGTASGKASGAGKWVDNGGGTWKYQKADGTYCVSEWLTVNGNTYFFGSDALMCTGWKQFTNSDWYYFNPANGAMVCSKWVTQNGKSYYLQANGVMAKNTTIDGKYKVNENGVYVEKVG